MMRELLAKWEGSLQCFGKGLEGGRKDGGSHPSRQLAVQITLGWSTVGCMVQV